MIVYPVDVKRISLGKLLVATNDHEVLVVFCGSRVREIVRPGDDSAIAGERIDYNRLRVHDRHQMSAQHLFDIEFGFRPRGLVVLADTGRQRHVVVERLRRRPGLDHLPAYLGDIAVLWAFWRGDTRHDPTNVDVVLLHAIKQRFQQGRLPGMNIKNSAPSLAPAIRSMTGLNSASPLLAA